MDCEAKMDRRSEIMSELNKSMQALDRAYNLGVAANPMAADLEVFKKLQTLKKDVATCMQQVGKVRGL